MKRRDFCKTTGSILLAWGINPTTAFSNTKNKVLSGQLLVNNKLEAGSFENLDNALVTTQNSNVIVKVENDVFLIRPNTKLKFTLNKMNEIIKGSFHGVFGKREEELLIKTPSGTIGIRGTAIYTDIDPQRKSYLLCNCAGQAVFYGNDKKLLKSLNGSHSVITITDQKITNASTFKHEAVPKKFRNK